MKIAEGLYVFPWNSLHENNCNTYLVCDGQTKILIDPGYSHLFDNVETSLNQLGIQVSDIDLVLATHAHRDHYQAVKLFKDEPARFAISLEDWRQIERLGEQIGPTFELEAYAPDFFLEPGDLDVGEVRLKIIPVPGHSPGSVALYWASRKALFSGDVVFYDGLGRTDLPGGNGALLKQSIKELASCDSEFLLSGHGKIIQGTSAVRANFKKVEEFWFPYI